MRKFSVPITDHAIVRFIERVYGINIEEVKKQILPEEKSYLVELSGGNCKIKLEKHTAVIENGVVVTVLDALMSKYLSQKELEKAKHKKRIRDQLLSA